MAGGLGRGTPTRRTALARSRVSRRSGVDYRRLDASPAELFGAPPTSPASSEQRNLSSGIDESERIGGTRRRKTLLAVRSLGFTTKGRKAARPMAGSDEYRERKAVAMTVPVLVVTPEVTADVAILSVVFACSPR